MIAIDIIDILFALQSMNFRGQSLSVVGGNFLRFTVEAIRKDYIGLIAAALATAEAYTDANINAAIPQTDSYPNKSGGAWGTLSVNHTSGVITVSKETYIAGKQDLRKNGQQLILGVDYRETFPSSGQSILTVKPLSTDKFTDTYFFISTPVLF